MACISLKSRATKALKSKLLTVTCLALRLERTVIAKDSFYITLGFFNPIIRHPTEEHNLLLLSRKVTSHASLYISLSFILNLILVMRRGYTYNLGRELLVEEAYKLQFTWSKGKRGFESCTGEIVFKCAFDF